MSELALSGIILGLDVGDKRVGLALTDEKRQIVFPHATVDRAQSNAEREIIALVAERGVTMIVAGLPLDDEDLETDQSEKVRQFCRRLSRRCTVPIVFHDEYGSSFEAEEHLTKLRGSSRKIKPGEIDSHAASIILRRYLDSL